MTTDLKRKLKELLIERLKFEDMTPADIGDDEPLFAGGLGLDSIDALFAEEPHYSDEAQRAEIEATLVGLKAHIARQLASDEEFELPCELDLGDDPDDSELRGWCIGFMEGVFLREAAWFETAEEEVSEMLLPIMVGSGLFDEQPEFSDIAADPNLMDDMIVQIPEALTALYLLCNAPDEKPAILKPRHH